MINRTRKYWLGRETTDKYVIGGLLSLMLLFMSLFILFTILFATKHENSSSFLLTGTSSSNVADIQKEINTQLNKEFYVNDLKVSINRGQVTAVFSLRDKQTTNEVEKSVLKISSSILQSPRLSDGSDGSLVCQPPAPPAPPTPPTTTVATTSIITTETPIPTASPYYCGDNQLLRDIVIVVDFLEVEDDRTSALYSLQKKMSSNFNFGPTRVFLMGADAYGAVNVSMDFASTSEAFNKDWDNMMTMDMTNGLYQIDTADLFMMINLLPFRNNIARAVFIMTSHSLIPIDTESELRQRGYFVAVARATLYEITGLDLVSSTGVLNFNDWASLANYDPFSTFTCQFAYEENLISSSNYFNPNSIVANDDVSANNTCQRVDIMFIFDTGYPPTFEDLWKDFAVNFASRFTLSGAIDGDNVNVGVIQFSENATLIMPIGQTTLDTFNTTVHSNVLDNTGGISRMDRALALAADQLSNTGHGQFIILMTARVPDNSVYFTNASSIAQKLIKQGIDIFFIGNGFLDKNTLDNMVTINGNASWIFNSTQDASTDLPNTLIDLYPCPIIACYIAYYAIESNDRGFTSQALTDISQIASQVNSVNNGTQYRLMLYNDRQKFIPSSGPMSYDDFQSMINQIVSNDSYINFESNENTLDAAFNALSSDISLQTLRNYGTFSSSVLFLGEANYYILSQGKDNTYTSSLNETLINAGNNLRDETTNVYTFDSSKDPTWYGENMWHYAVPTNATYPYDREVFTKLYNSDYYQKIHNMTCAPQLARCDYNFIDVAVVLDIVDSNTTGIQNYLDTVLNLFNMSYASHFSMIAMGLNTNAVTLMTLNNYTNSQEFVAQSFINYSVWRKNITQATTTNTPTIASNPTEELADQSSSYPMTTAIINSMFVELRKQFGCNYTAADRIMAPNIVLLISDNFESYTADVMEQFTGSIKEQWYCDDCPGRPLIYFAGYNSNPPDHGLGQFNITNIDTSTKLTSKAINDINKLVTGVCKTPMPSCPSFVTQNICKDTPVFQ